MQGSQPRDELRLNAFKLTHVEQARAHGAGFGERRLLRDKGGMPGFELAEHSLQRGDLGAQLVSARCLGVR